MQIASDSAAAHSAAKRRCAGLPATSVIYGYMTAAEVGEAAGSELQEDYGLYLTDGHMHAAFPVHQASQAIIHKTSGSILVALPEKRCSTEVKGVYIACSLLKNQIK